MSDISNWFLGRTVKRLTSGFPLLLVHRTLPVRVHNLHSHHEFLELLLFGVFGKYLVEFFFINRVQGVFRSQTVTWIRKPVISRNQMGSQTSVLIYLGREEESVRGIVVSAPRTIQPCMAMNETHPTKLSQSTIYSGTSSTASLRKK